MVHRRGPLLHRSEICLYFGVYIAYLLYGLYSIHAVRNVILQNAKYEFSAGWSWLGRPRDATNDELESFREYVVKWWPWYFIHAFIVTAVRCCYPARQSSAHAVVCAAALLCNLQLVSVTLLALLLCSYYIWTIFVVRSKRAVWLHSAFWMFVINWIKNSEYCYQVLGYAQYYTLIIMLSWSLLRCVSFSLNRLTDVQNNVPKVLDLYCMEHFFGYTLYWPMLIYGPFMGYRRYLLIQQINNKLQKNLVDRLCQLAWELLRVVFWWTLLELALHFLYIHYMTRDVSAVQLVGPTFGQHAVGYFMGQFFYMYYVVTYGLGIAFAQHDGLAPPNRPRCIGRIHFYSDMWKHFDEGLYEFLFRHIYAELCERKSSLLRKLFATAATFSFVFVWHGCYMYVLIWSILNFCCLVAENFFKSFVSSAFYEQKITVPFGLAISQRLRALLATQLFIPAAFSNVYFIGGDELGNYLMRGAYLSGWGNYLALSFCSYCFFQCSEVILNWHRK